MKLFLILLLSIASTLTRTYVQTGEITVIVSGISNDKGTVFINLYNSEEGFPSDMKKSIQTIKLQAVKNTMQYVFKNLPKGIYALSIMHDENNNGKMDKNILGIPAEGYCVSNNAKGFMTAPSFSDAKFILNKDTTQDLKLIY